MHGSVEKVARADTRRQAILEVAREVFLQEGYAAASMSVIAARVGGSKATLYSYFPSKEQLFGALIWAECQEGAAPAFDELRRGGDVATVLARVGNRFMRFLTLERVMSLHRLVIAESVRFPELGRAFYEAGPQRALRLLADFMQEAMDAGKLRHADPMVGADQFVHLCKACLYQKRLWNLEAEPSEAEIATNVALAVETFIAAYGPAEQVASAIPNQPKVNKKAYRA